MESDPVEHDKKEEVVEPIEKKGKESKTPKTPKIEAFWVFTSRDSEEIEVFASKEDVIAYIKTIRTKSPYAVHQVDFKNGSTKKVIKWPLVKPSTEKQIVAPVAVGKIKTRTQFLDE